MAFRSVPVRPKCTTDHDATTTTRDTKSASYAPARPVPRVRRVYDGHGGAVVVLAVGRVVFVLWEPPRAGGWGAVKKVPLRSKIVQARGVDRVVVRLFFKVHFFLGLGYKMSTKQPKMSKNGKF